MSLFCFFVPYPLVTSRHGQEESIDMVSNSLIRTVRRLFSSEERRRYAVSLTRVCFSNPYKN